MREWLRTLGLVRLLDDCAALMLMEYGGEAERELLRTLSTRPSLIKRIALRRVLQTLRSHQVAASTHPIRGEKLIGETRIEPQRKRA